MIGKNVYIYTLFSCLYIDALNLVRNTTIVKQLLKYSCSMVLMNAVMS